MLKLPWVKPKNATLPELQEQIEHARAAHTAAMEAIGPAQAAFDDDGSASAEKALLAAQDAERSAGQHLARAERLVAAAEELRKFEELAELGRKLKGIDAQLQNDPVSADLVKVEIAALEAVADARVARFENNMVRSRLRAEQRRLREALGLPVEPLSVHFVDDISPNPIPVREALLALARGNNDDPRSRYLRELSDIQIHRPAHST